MQLHIFVVFCDVFKILRSGTVQRWLGSKFKFALCWRNFKILCDCSKLVRKYINSVFQLHTPTTSTLCWIQYIVSAHHDIVSRSWYVWSLVLLYATAPCFPLYTACGPRYGCTADVVAVPRAYECTYIHLLLQYIFSILQMNILCKINYMYVNLERQKKILFIEMVYV